MSREVASGNVERSSCPRWMWMSPGSRPSHDTFPEGFPARSRMPPRITINTPNPSRILPRSLIALRLAGRRRRTSRAGARAWPPRRDRQAGHARGARTPPRSRARPLGAPHDVSDLQQEGLDDLGQRLGLVVDRGGDGLEADGPAAVLLDDRGEEPAVQAVEPAASTPSRSSASRARPRRDRPVAPHLTVVAHAPEQPVGDARRAPGAARDGLGAAGSMGASGSTPSARRWSQLLDRVEVQVVEDAEALAQRRADSMPGRVVAPTSVNGRSGILMLRAFSPLSMTKLTEKSSIAGYSSSSTARGSRWISSMNRTSRSLEIGQDAHQVGAALERRAGGGHHAPRPSRWP